jgi:hypothetical protein
MGVGDDVTALVDDESGTSTSGHERITVGSVFALRRAVIFIIGARRLVAARDLIAARDLGYAGKAVDPGEAAEVGVADRLQIQDSDDRGICFLRNVGHGHLGRRRRVCRAKRGAAPAVDHRLCGDPRGKNASRQDAKPGRAEDQSRRQCPGQCHLAQAAHPLSGHTSAPLFSIWARGARRLVRK